MYRAPSGLTATLNTVPMWPLRMASSARVNASQTRAVPSEEPVTHRAPSGLKATLKTPCKWPVRRRKARVECAAALSCARRVGSGLIPRARSSSEGSPASASRMALAWFPTSRARRAASAMRRCLSVEIRCSRLNSSSRSCFSFSRLASKLKHYIRDLRLVGAAARPELRCSNRAAAEQLVLGATIAVPASCQVHEPRVFMPPSDVSLERTSKRAGLGLEIVRRIEEEIIDLGDGRGDLVVSDALEHDGRQPLVQRGHLLDLPPAHGRGDRTLAHDEHHRIGPTDENEEFAPPVL